LENVWLVLEHELDTSALDESEKFCSCCYQYMHWTQGWIKVRFSSVQ